ncbi:MAG: pyruvate:ferredoxin (flavodoxin) oxidoreductase [Propionibacterium sp.]|nr:pyruvate:ferredoxin (flavodoxin) oxidoreductase [Propionibacterium sp.]
MCEAGTVSVQWATMDGNEAAARVAHKLSEVIAIYPITPSSAMAESADAWSAAGKQNLWGEVPEVIEMQSEAGAAGTLHGAITKGTLGTTFTASQGLLLMIPNMYKIAGELTPAVIHVAARTIATHALSIFGDHSDVMGARQTGWAMLCASSVQEAHDFSLVAHSATLRSRVPFLHFFDGFRTSHEENKIQLLADADLRALVRESDVLAHRARGLTPDAPQIRGTAQNPDVFFQAREAANLFHDAVPQVVAEVFDELATRTGRRYSLVEYHGASDAERIVVVLGSAWGTTCEAVDELLAQGEKVGAVTLRLYRPFPASELIAALPRTTRSIAVLDRTKEPGAAGEPLFADVMIAVAENVEHFSAGIPKVIGGRYGLSSKEFTPAMAAAVFAELTRQVPKPRFTVGINDDVTHLSLAVPDDFEVQSDALTAVFYGLGSDGTVGAAKNTVKIIGSDADRYAQGYFVYDSRKSGATTVSHLRFGGHPIKSAYLIDAADFVAVHQFELLSQMRTLDIAKPGATVLLNSPYGEFTWGELPVEVQQLIIDRDLKVWVVDAAEVARQAGLGKRINTVMQPCFFYLSGVVPREQALARIKASVEASYGRRGRTIVERNFAAIDASVTALAELQIPAIADGVAHRMPPMPQFAPDFVKQVTAVMLRGEGDLLPVSAMPVDGTWPSGTSKYEKRGIAEEIPIWDPSLCIDCGKCAIVCPHSAIRIKVTPAADLADAPDGFLSKQYKDRKLLDHQLIVQVAPDDCTGCGICVDICPARSKTEVKHKSINMSPRREHLERERTNFEYFLGLPEMDRTKVRHDQVKGAAQLQPLFEFSLACSGCGETPYIRTLTQLFGDRLIMANATGCSSIYGGNLPTTPWAKNDEGRGPAWSNSLFEDNAEFGLGMRLAADLHTALAKQRLEQLRAEIDDDALVDGLLSGPQETMHELRIQYRRMQDLYAKLDQLSGPLVDDLRSVADHLMRRSVWIIGGDGWAYDIGSAGLDHVLASGRNVNILVMDTEVYSNTGGQASKSTPLGAVAKFATGGKTTNKKDLAMQAVAYGHVYVARVALGADPQQTLKAFREAEAYDGPSLIIAYSHCISHGIDMRKGLEQQYKAVACGHWPLMRFNPVLRDEGQNPFLLDSPRPRISLKEYRTGELRFKMLTRSNPEEAERLLEISQQHVLRRYAEYEQLAGRPADMFSADARAKAAVTQDKEA